MMRLAGRFAIITGASQGLGEEIANHFVAEGASVLLCARSWPAVQAVEQRLSVMARNGQKVLARAADVSKRRDVDEIVVEALDGLKMAYPKTTGKRRKELLAIRKELEG